MSLKYEPASEPLHISVKWLWGILKLNPTLNQGEVSGVSVHATGEYIVSTSTDKSWAFCDIAAGKCLQLVQVNLEIFRPAKSASQKICLYPAGITETRNSEP